MGTKRQKRVRRAKSCRLSTGIALILLCSKVCITERKKQGNLGKYLELSERILTFASQNQIIVEHFSYIELTLHIRTQRVPLCPQRGAAKQGGA